MVDLVVKVDLVDLKDPHIDMLDMTDKLDRWDDSSYLYISARKLAGSLIISKRPLNGPITNSANVSYQKYRIVPGAWWPKGEGGRGLISGDS